MHFELNIVKFFQSIPSNTDNMRINTELHNFEDLVWYTKNNVHIAYLNCISLGFNKSSTSRALNKTRTNCIRPIIIEPKATVPK